MATPIFACGGECGLIGTGTEHILNGGTGGTVSIETGTVHAPDGTSGVRAVRIAASASTAPAAAFADPLSSNVKVQRWYAYFVTLPDQPFLFGAFSGINGAYFSPSDGKIYASANGTLNTGVSVTTGRWYRIDVRINQSANPWLVDVQVAEAEGAATPCGQSSAALGAASVGHATAGFLSVGSVGTVIVDDLLVSSDGADYPIGPGKITGHVPNADGTHTSTGTNIIKGTTSSPTAGPAITAATTDAYTYVNARPIGGGATDATRLINQAASAATEYVEVDFESTGEANGPRAVEVLTGDRQAATQNGSFQTKLNDNGTEDVIISRSAAGGSVSDRWVTKQYATMVGGGAWTTGRFNALKVRFGYSSDANPDQYWRGVMIEAEFAVASGTVVTSDVTTTAATSAPVTSNVTTDAAISAVVLSNVTTDAAISRAISSEVTTTAAIGMAVDSNVTTTAAVSRTEVLNVTTTAAISAVVLSNVTTDAAISRTITSDVTTTAAIGTQVNSDVTTTAATSVKVSTDVTTDASITSVAHPILDVTTTAAISAVVVSNVTTDASISANPSLSVTTDAAVNRVELLNVTTDAVITRSITSDVTTTAALGMAAQLDVTSTASISAPTVLYVTTDAAISVFIPPPPSVDEIAAALAGGAVVITRSFEQRDNQFRFVADLTPAVLRADIELDNSRAIVRTARFTLDPRTLPANFDPNEANLSVTATLSVGGTPIPFTIGLFRLDLTDEEFSPLDDVVWSADGSDLTILLQQARIHEPFTLDVNTPIVEAVRALCDSEGLSHDFPEDPDANLTPIARTWPVETPKLAIANDLFEAINWFPVYSTNTGIQTSRPILNPDEEDVSVTYSTATEPRMIVPSFRRRKNKGRYPNRVTISVSDPLRMPEYGTVEDADPGSPNSTINSPLSAVEEQKGLVIDQAMALRIADFRVRDAAASAIEGTLITDFDPRRTAHETYRLVIEQHEQSTIWRVRGWTLSMENGATMQHTLGKVDPITTTVIP